MAIRTTLSCLGTFIGVRADCITAEVPTSGLFINDLPGITIKTAGDVQDGEWTSGIRYLQDLRDRVAEEEADNLGMLFQSHIITRPFVELGTIGEYRHLDDGSDYLATEAIDKGIEICLHNSSPLMRIRIESIEALTNTTNGAKVITIEDGDISSTVTIALTAGTISKVSVNQEINTDKVWIKWDTSDIAVNDSRLRQSNCKGCGGKVSKGYRNWNYVRVRGKTDNEDNLSQTFGLRVNFVIECSWERLICHIRNNLKRLIWYKCGMDFAEQVLIGDRYNAITSLKRAAYERQLDPEVENSWINKYKDQKQYVSRAIAGQLKRFGKDCIDCKSATIKTLEP